jgi:type II secretory pathway component PulC
MNKLDLPYFALLLSLTLLVSKVYGENENCDLSRFEYKGYQITSKEQWAILGIRGREDEVFFKGENIFGVASLLEINSKYLTLKCSQSGKLYKLGGDGISALKTSSFLESLSNNPQLRHLIFKKKSNNVIKVEAEHPSLYSSVPSTIYLSYSNKLSELSDSELGIGGDVFPRVVEGENAGIVLALPDKNSLLGGFGFQPGDVIVSINGHVVSDKNSIRKALEDQNSGIVNFVYMARDLSGYLEGKIAVKKSA